MGACPTGILGSRRTTKLTKDFRIDFFFQSYKVKCALLLDLRMTDFSGFLTSSIGCSQCTGYVYHDIFFCCQILRNEITSWQEENKDHAQIKTRNLLPKSC